MTALDWIVLIVTLGGITLYGLYKSRATRNFEGYFLSNRNMPWYIVLLGVMGTQASAVTYLSGPGQAYTDGMRFVQYYFGLPLAMVVICVVFVPIFSKMKVQTAYAFLEKRFDVKTRVLTSLLFLFQRGVSTGISIYAPSLILASLFGWDIFWTNIIMGGFLFIYTVSGGAKAIAHTQQVQFLLICAAMLAAGYFVVKLLPQGVGFTEAMHVGGKMGKLNIITPGTEKGSFDWNDRYNIWSGLIGGFFLALSYFGTDHSQVGRYITAKNDRESKLGLLLNGLFKVPMQFLILLLGVLIFAFYQFHAAPLSFNSHLTGEVKASPYKDSLAQLEQRMQQLGAIKAQKAAHFATAIQQNNTAVIETLTQDLKALQAQENAHRAQFAAWSKAMPGREGKDTKDTNYIFLFFAKNHLPQGLKGLLIAVIFLAGWGSIAAALNALAATSVMDLHQRFRAVPDDKTEYKLSRWYTLGWGVFCIIVAQFANQLGNSLIEAVNIFGSLFYGVILGIFLLAFFAKKVGGTATFIAAIAGEMLVCLLFFKDHVPFFKFLPDISFLWLTGVGAAVVYGLALLIQTFSKPMLFRQCFEKSN